MSMLIETRLTHGRSVPGWVLRACSGGLAMVALVLTGVGGWFPLVFGLGVACLLLTMPRPLLSAILLGVVAFLILLEGSEPLRVALLILASHLLFTLVPLAGLVPWHGRIETAVLRAGLPSFYAAQVLAQCAWIAGWVLQAHFVQPWLAVAVVAALAGLGWYFAWITKQP